MVEVIVGASIALYFISLCGVFYYGIRLGNRQGAEKALNALKAVDREATMDLVRRANKGTRA